MLTFLDSASPSSVEPIGWKCWRGLTKFKKPNLLIVQVAPDGFIELYIDDRRTKARCSSQACKSSNAFYRVKDDNLVDDPRLRHHDSCSMEVKKADDIREEQFCR
uniref:Uncharacterized protein n=1 Tax=Panagrolaimus davidi TaxID=227884 RepID=A0A914PGV2_9BILA